MSIANQYWPYNRGPFLFREFSIEKCDLFCRIRYIVIERISNGGSLNLSFYWYTWKAMIVIQICYTYIQIVHVRFECLKIYAIIVYLSIRSRREFDVCRYIFSMDVYLLYVYIGGAHHHRFLSKEMVLNLSNVCWGCYQSSKNVQRQ